MLLTLELVMYLISDYPEQNQSSQTSIQSLQHIGNHQLYGKLKRLHKQDLNVQQGAVLSNESGDLNQIPVSSIFQFHQRHPAML